MRTQGSRLGQTTELLRGLARSAYVPALVVGGAMQFAAVLPGSGPLAAAGLVLGAAADLLTAGEAHPWRGRLRRAGLGVVQRASLRALLVLAAITVEPVPAATAAWFVVATIGAVVASRVWRWSLEKVVATEPAMAVRNLGGDGSLTGVFESTRRRRTIGSGVLVSVEIPIGLAMLAGAEGVLAGGAVRWVMGLAVAVAGLAAAVALAWSVRFRRSGRVENHLEVLREELERYGAPVIAYFSGAVGTTYQLNQWLPVFDRSTVPILVVIRERHHLEQLVPTGLPVLYCRTTRDVEEALTASARVVLYVANAGRNIHLQRFPQLKHAFLNHGDSDKASSANPVVRIYDQLRRIEQVLADAGSPHVLAGDHPDVDLLGWFEHSDVLITDISAVATDWLATSRPNLVANPRNLESADFRGTYPSHVAAYVIGTHPDSLKTALQDALGPDPLLAARLETQRRVLGEHPTGPQATLDRAVVGVIEEAEPGPMRTSDRCRPRRCRSRGWDA